MICWPIFSYLLLPSFYLDMVDFRVTRNLIEIVLQESEIKLCGGSSSVSASAIILALTLFVQGFIVSNRSTSWSCSDTFQDYLYLDIRYTQPPKVTTDTYFSMKNWMCIIQKCCGTRRKIFSYYNAICLLRTLPVSCRNPRPHAKERQNRKPPPQYFSL